MKIKEMLKSGNNVILSERQEREKEKAGVFRGGSCGCKAKDGRIYGTCPRKALLRYVGLQGKDTWEDYMYYIAGYGHELNVATLAVKSPDIKLVTTYNDSDFIQTHDKFKVIKDSLTYEQDGIKISASPDFILEDKEGKKRLLETKVTISTDKAKETTKYALISAICQATLYYKMLGGEVDTASIIYGNYSNFSTWYPKWEISKKNISFKLDNGKYIYPTLEYREYPSGVYEKIPCDINEFTLLFDGDKVAIRRESDGVELTTPITISGTIEYFKDIKEKATQHILPDRPEEVELYGKMAYSPCKYCEHSKECEAYDNNVITFEEYFERIGNNIKEAK